MSGGLYERTISAATVRRRNARERDEMPPVPDGRCGSDSLPQKGGGIRIVGYSGNGSAVVSLIRSSMKLDRTSRTDGCRSSLSITNRE